MLSTTNQPTSLAEQNISKMARILDEGFLLQPAGIDPFTKEPYTPTWVSRKECSEDEIQRWQDTKRCIPTAKPKQEAVVDEPSNSVQICPVKPEPVLVTDLAAVHPERARLLAGGEPPETGGASRASPRMFSLTARKMSQKWSTAMITLKTMLEEAMPSNLPVQTTHRSARSDGMVIYRQANQAL